MFFLIGTVHRVRDALPNVKQAVTVGLLRAFKVKLRVNIFTFKSLI